MNNIVFEHKGLSLERLRLLCDVARMGGIRAAVGDDPARQSLASRQLKELSEYANTELIRRVGRGIEVTKEGTELACIGNEFFSKMSAFLQRTHNLPIDFRLGVGDSIFQCQVHRRGALQTLRSNTFLQSTQTEPTPANRRDSILHADRGGRIRKSHHQIFISLQWTTDFELLFNDANVRSRPIGAICGHTTGECRIGNK